MSKEYKNKNGFTIVELIIVMAIIAILILMAVPTYKKYMSEAKELQYRANVETVTKAIMMFQAQNPDLEKNYQEYTTETEYDEWMGLTYIRPEFLQPYIQGDVIITDDEMQVMYDGYVRVEYTARRPNENYNFEIQVGGSYHDRPEGKEYGRYYYDEKK